MTAHLERPALRGIVRRYPDFFIIGAAKSGTTTLHDYLRMHPSLWMSADKEPCFFDPNVPPERRDPGTYSRLFDGAEDEQLCAESSTNYAMWPLVPDVPLSISQVNPNARFIYLLRDPIARCYSHFKHRHERETLPGRPYRMTFEQYLEFDPLIADASDYASQIQQYLEYFPKESILLLSFERFVKKPVETLRQVYEFLGVEDRSEEDGAEPMHSNDSGDFARHALRSYTTAPLKKVPGLQALYNRMPASLKAMAIALVRKSPLARSARRKLTPPPMLPETRARLQERFDASNAFLEAEFGFDASGWSSSPRT